MDPKKTLSGIIALLLLATALLIFSPWVLRSVFGLLLVLFIPGFISTYAFFKEDEIDIIERVTFSIGLSISFVVLVVMFSNLYLGVPITTITVVLQISGLCLFFALIVMAKRSSSIMGAYKRGATILTLKAADPKRTLTRLGPLVLVFLLAFNLAYPAILSDSAGQYGNRNTGYVIYNPAERTFDKASATWISHPYLIDFENGLVFLGYDISPSLKRGEKAHINYYFQSKKDAIHEGLTVVTDFSIKEPVFQTQFPFPSVELKKGQVFMVSNDITLPKEIQPQIYTMHVSLYEGYTPLETKDSTEAGRVNIPYYFDELYNPSMEIKSFYNGMPLAPEEAGISHQRVYIFDDKIAFLGYDMDPEELSPAQQFQVTYYWKSLDATEKDYTVFVHVIDSLGNIVFQHDHMPPIPTSRWTPGDIISEKYDVFVPSGINESTYRIRFGIYDVSTGKRMPLSGAGAKDNAPYLGQITVREKRIDDYYTPEISVLVLNTKDNTAIMSRNITIANPRIIDYGPVIMLGYDLGTLHAGETANLTYYIKAKETHKDYAIHTLITEKDGPGVISFDTELPHMRKGDIIALIVPVDVPASYGRNSLFTFALKDNITGEYIRSSSTVFEHVEIT